VSSSLEDFPFAGPQSYDILMNQYRVKDFGFDDVRQEYWFILQLSRETGLRLRQSQNIINCLRNSDITLKVGGPFFDWDYETTAIDYVLKSHGATHDFIDRPIYKFRFFEWFDFVLKTIFMFSIDAYIVSSENLKIFVSHNDYAIFISSEKIILRNLASNFLKEYD